MSVLNQNSIQKCPSPEDQLDFGVSNFQTKPSKPVCTFKCLAGESEVFGKIITPGEMTGGECLHACPCEISYLVGG